MLLSGILSCRNQVAFHGVFGIRKPPAVGYSSLTSDKTSTKRERSLGTVPAFPRLSVGTLGRVTRCVSNLSILSRWKKAVSLRRVTALPNKEEH